MSYPMTMPNGDIILESFCGTDWILRAGVVYEEGWTLNAMCDDYRPYSHPVAPADYTNNLREMLKRATSEVVL